MKKKLLIISLLIMMVIMQGCTGKDMTAGLADEDIILKAIENTLQAESLEIDSNVVFKVDSAYQPIDAEVTGQSKIFNNPLLIENSYLVINKTTGQQEEYKSYIQILNDKMVGYIFQGNAWYQGENLISPEEIVNNPGKNLSLFADNPSDQGFFMKADETEATIENSVKYDLFADVGIYPWVLNQSFLSLNLGAFVQDPEALEAMGDFVLSVWIDKSTLNIVRMELDFSENLNKLGNYLENDEEVPENVVELFKNFNYKVTYDLGNFDKVERVTVPLEARMGMNLDA